MTKEYNIEKLNSIRNEMSHLWGAIFLLGGGSIGLILSEISPVKIFFGIVGLCSTLLVANAYAIRRAELLEILNKLKGEQ